jgi:GntR family transcriptional regulator of vanillate catabolism
MKSARDSGVGEGNLRSHQQLRAVMRLREMIVSGAFAAGERISEMGAVEKLGISRTPVRLALSALAFEGLLQPLASGGFIVRDFSIADIFDAIELRGVLEGTAARMAAQKSGTTRETATLCGLLDELETLVRSDRRDDEAYASYAELNGAFHAEMVRLAKSPFLERSLAQIVALPFASPSALVKVQSKRGQNSDILLHAQFQHRAIVEAIRSGDGGRAFALGSEHAHLAAANLREALKQNDLFDQVPGAQLIRLSGAEDL